MPLISPDLTELTTSSQATRLYNMIDFITGRGIANFYGADFEDATKLLTTMTFYAHKGYTTNGLNAASDISLDLTLSVNPMDVDGDVIITIPLLGYNGTGGTTTVGSSVTATLYHVDTAATATSLGVVAVSTSTPSIANNTAETAFFTGKVNVSKVFGQGEKLRLRVQTGAPGSGKQIYIGHDPANRDIIINTAWASSNWVSSQLKVLVPVRTNL